jgi:hypothetical protein
VVFVLDVLNILLFAAMSFVIFRLVIGMFIRNEQNPVWQALLVVTGPPYSVTRALTGGRLPERWVPALTLVWIVVVRGFLFSLYPARPGP